MLPPASSYEACGFSLFPIQQSSDWSAIATAPPFVELKETVPSLLVWGWLSQTSPRWLLSSQILVAWDRAHGIFSYSNESMQ